jgi:hypothetical protein
MAEMNKKRFLKWITFIVSIMCIAVSVAYTTQVTVSADYSSATGGHVDGDTSGDNKGTGTQRPGSDTTVGAGTISGGASATATTSATNVGNGTTAADAQAVAVNNNKPSLDAGTATNSQNNSMNSDNQNTDAGNVSTNSTSASTGPISEQQGASRGPDKQPVNSSPKNGNSKTKQSSEFKETYSRKANIYRNAKNIQKKVDKINSTKLNAKQRRIVKQYERTAPGEILKTVDPDERNSRTAIHHSLPGKIVKKIVKKVLIKKYGKKFVYKKFPKRIYKHLPKKIRKMVRLKTFKKGYKMILNGAGKTVGKTAYKFLRHHRVPKWAAVSAKVVIQAVIDWVL